MVLTPSLGKLGPNYKAYQPVVTPTKMLGEVPYSGKILREKTFHELIKNTIFVEETFANSHKTAKFAKVSCHTVVCMLLVTDNTINTYNYRPLYVNWLQFS